MKRNQRLGLPYLHVATLATFGLICACTPPPLAVGRTSGPDADADMGGPGGNGGDHGVVSGIVPNSASAPVPPSIKLGSRITFQMDSASIAGQGSVWTPDPNGQWVNGNGQRFDRSPKEMSGSAKSLQQYDVIALDDKRAVLLKTEFLVNPTPYLSNVSYMTGPAGFAGDLWADPDSLQKLPNLSHDDQKIARGPWKVGNRTTDAVELSHSWPNMRDLFVYDLKTGLLLQHNIAATGHATPTAPDENTSTGNSLLVSIAITGFRQISIPWAGSPDPEWTKTLHSLTYNGTSIMSTRADNQGAIPHQFTAKFAVLKRGAGWTSFNRTVDAGNGSAGPPEPIVTTQNELTPLWIAPESLAKLQPGQTIDSDPLSGLITRVGQTQNGPKGPMIDIVQGNSVMEIHVGYDLKTGLMVRVDNQNRGTFTHVAFELRSTD